MKTALLFYLVIGQAADGYNSLGTSTAVVPTPYTSLQECINAGEAARANNMGLSFLSYTCAPAPKETSK